MPNICKTCQVHQTKGKPNRIVTVCKKLGRHLVEEELSNVIDDQIRTIPPIQHHTHLTSTQDHKHATRTEQDIGSARTDVTFGEKTESVSTRHPSHTVSKRASSVTSRQHRSKRKMVTRYTTSGYTASTKHTKFGDETLLGLCRSQPVPHTKLTIEGYREQLEDILKELNRGDLLPTLNKTRPLFKDLVEDFYMKQRPKEEATPRRVLRSAMKQCTQSERQSSRLKAAKLRPVTCEVRMRVRIQYKSHRHLLTGIESINNTKEERQMDKFIQATNVMRGRDTGCVVCNISFSDITYLGAFWRDYSNGALQDALRGVFLTEMMRQTAGDEELDLLVSVDEKDFLEGQKLLVKNLVTGSGSGSTGFSVRGQIGVPATARIEQNVLE